jgi:hypothetical protein
MKNEEWAGWARAPIFHSSFFILHLNDMMSAEDEDAPKPAEPLRLDYATPDAPTDEPSPLIAMLAALPGGVCWVILLAAAVNRVAPRLLRLPTLPGPSLVAVAFLWVFVLVAGMVAIVAYLDRPKPWHVLLSLAINISGLALTLLLFCVLLGG